MTMAAMTPGLNPPPVEWFAPPPDPLPSPLVEPPPLPPVVLPGFPVPGCGRGAWVISVLTPEIVVKITFPGPPESPGESPWSEFCALGPEGCTGPSWGSPLDWEGEDPLVGDGLGGFDRLRSGEFGLEVEVGVLGGVLGSWAPVSPLPGFEEGGVLSPPPPPPPCILSLPVSGMGVGVGVGRRCGGFCCGGFCCGGFCCGGFCCGGGVTVGLGFDPPPFSRGSRRGMEGNEMGRSRRPRRSKLLDASILELELNFLEWSARCNGITERERAGWEQESENKGVRKEGGCITSVGKG